MHSRMRHTLPRGATPYDLTDEVRLALLRTAQGADYADEAEAFAAPHVKPDLYLCYKCGTLGTDEARCLSCGEHRP